jgi:hypothetical protein
MAENSVNATAVPVGAASCRDEYQSRQDAAPTGKSLRRVETMKINLVSFLLN